MKFRSDFVTNSSSSSFLISKKGLSENQINAIRFNGEMGKKLGLLYADYSYNIKENSKYMSGYTCIDNYDIYELFDLIGVKSNVIARGEYMIPLPSDIETSSHDNEEEWVKILNEILEEKENEEDEVD